MIIKPKFRGFICTNAHRVGCEVSVKEQIDYVKSQGKITGPKNVLILGASTGYGLASSVVSLFGSNANVVGVFFEKEASENRTGTGGWYNFNALQKFAEQEGLYLRGVNGDAFSNEIKDKTIALIKEHMKQVDLVIYSLASPRRTDPVTNQTYISALRPIGNTFVVKSIDIHSGKISDVSIDPATTEDIESTRKVMGGEDWELWIKALNEAGVLANEAVTTAYSYIGPVLTYPVYREGTLGLAKKHLEETATKIQESLKNINGKAYTSVCKALVTQASSAIPAVPLYIAILYKVMKEKGVHEGCIEQIYRLFKTAVYGNTAVVDDLGRVRLDDWELADDIQEEILRKWDVINSDNVEELSDVAGYRKEFFKLFGFGHESIDYDQDIEI